MLSVAVLPVLLLTLGVLNWCTTCCCGNSMILEILHGTCEHHGEKHDGSDHPGSDPHPCHKGGGDAFLTAADPDIDCSPEAASLPADSIHLLSWSPSSTTADWSDPGRAPPDIPLMTQRLLI